ncbi:MAG: ATP synthase F1 subunit gamma [Acidobacteria bacterium]|nr:ATP synthase F1 subunit gamma [Acidobacteriota bacterium]
MPNLLDIRRRIRSVKNTQQITKAMKMVAASRLRRTSDQAIRARPYSERLFCVHDTIVERMPELSGPLYRRQEGKWLLVVVSSDKGLCGAFNSNLLKAANNWLKHKGTEHVEVMPIGRKATAFFRKTPFTVVPGLKEPIRDVDVSTAETVAKLLLDRYLAGGLQEVVVLYNKFKNVLVQEITFAELLPLIGDSRDKAAVNGGVEHLAEPNAQAILDELGPKVLLTQVYQALMESTAAEHAARMTAMEAATNNAGEMIEKLTLDLNKARQAAITKELIEIVSGAAAL